MKLNKLIALPVLTAAFALSVAAPKANAATSNATLTIQNFTQVSTSDSVSMSPSLVEVQAGEKESLSAITLSVVTNNGAGCKVTVKAAEGDSRDTKINPGDILIKSGTTGRDAAFADYSALSTTAADLWNTNSSTVAGTDVELDVKFINLDAYTASNTSYTNTITFTAVAN